MHINLNQLPTVRATIEGGSPHRSASGQLETVTYGVITTFSPAAQALSKTAPATAAANSAENVAALKERIKQIDFANATPDEIHDLALELVHTGELSGY